jgi:hypothetical protein
MNEIMKDLSGVAMAIMGVAILAVLVSKNNNTSQVIGSAASGFGSVLGVAMGAAAGSGSGTSPMLGHY